MLTEIVYKGERKAVEHSGDATLLELVRSHFECGFAPCASHGCGRCLCRIEGGEREGMARACSLYPREGERFECLFEVDYLSG